MYIFKHTMSDDWFQLKHYQWHAYPNIQTYKQWINQQIKQNEAQNKICTLGRRKRMKKIKNMSFTFQNELSG